MRKRALIFGIICIIIALILGIKPILKLSSRIFWNIVVAQFDKEEKDRQQKVENGEIVKGKDTVLIWGDIYDIGHYLDGNNLEIYINNTFETILEKIKVHKIVKETLYIISDEGYAVINKDNLCKVYIIVPENEFINGYSVDEQENKIYYSRFVKNEHVKYLSEYDEFSIEEKEIFNKLLTTFDK